MNIEPIRGDFAARISGVDLGAPPDAETSRRLRAAIDGFAVIVLRDQPIDDDAQVAFSERFGTLETPLEFDQYAGVHRLVTRLANVRGDGAVMAPDSHHATYMKGNQLWHTDSSFKPVPAKYSILHAREVPPTGGGTEFADCRAAWDDWEASSEGLRREDLEPLECEHSIVWSRSLIIGDFFTEAEKAKLPPVRQRLVRTHPVTGRRSLYAGAHASHVVDWPLERGRRLIGEINAFCIRPGHVYSHEWRAGDLVMWDNRSVLHRGLPHDPSLRRVMHRTTVAGDGAAVDAG